MTHITIRLASPPTGIKSTREIIRIKTPEGFLRETGDNVVVETEDSRLGMVDSCCEDETKKTSLPSESYHLPVFAESSEGAKGNGSMHVHLNGEKWTDDSTVQQTVLGSFVERDNPESVRNGYEEKELNYGRNSPVKCRNCHGGWLFDPKYFESELYLTRKDLASLKGQLEAVKARLEEELVERFKLEEELKSEGEVHENETQVLMEKIECLEINESQKAKKIVQLESMLLFYKEEREKGCQELEDLRVFVSRYQTEVNKLRAEANSANDQAAEARNEIELLTKKAEKNDREKDKIRNQLRKETEEHWREGEESRKALENWEQLHSEKSARIHTLAEELALHKRLVDELRQELADASSPVRTDERKMNYAMESSKVDELFSLCHDLSDIYREHLSNQKKCSDLSLVLNTTHKELEEARSRSEHQNLALQDFKQKYNDLHDIMVALREENCHLRNKLEKKCAEFREIRRKFIVSETEVSWLKEALNVVDNAKKKSLCHSTKVVDVQT